MTDNDLGKIAEAIQIAKATLRNMRQNLVIAMLTVSGLLAGVAHSGASGRLFQRHPVSHSGVSGRPEMTPLSVVS